MKQVERKKEVEIGFSLREIKRGEHTSPRRCRQYEYIDKSPTVVPSLGSSHVRSKYSNYMMENLNPSLNDHNYSRYGDVFNRHQPGRTIKTEASDSVDSLIHNRWEMSVLGTQEANIEKVSSNHPSVEEIKKKYGYGRLTREIGSTSHLTRTELLFSEKNPSFLSEAIHNASVKHDSLNLLQDFQQQQLNTRTYTPTENPNSKSDTQFYASLEISHSASINRDSVLRSISDLDSRINEKVRRIMGEGKPQGDKQVSRGSHHFD